MVNIKALPQPQIIEQIDYEVLLEENINRIKTKFPTWQPLESDDWMPLIESFTYKEVLLRARINESIKAMLLATSKGSDLDNLAAGLDIERLPGTNPYAPYEFELSKTAASDVVIPANIILSSEDGVFKGHLKESLTVPAGETKITGTVELDLNIEYSEAKTEIITSPLPYVLKAKSLEPFNHGSLPESDDELVERYLLSLRRFSTAGSVGSYKFHAMSADERVDDVSVDSPSPGVVNVYLASSDGVDQVMIDRVLSVLSHEKVRPLTDTVNVSAANIITINISAAITVFDLAQAAAIENSIRSNFQRRFKIDQNFTMSDIVKSCHVEGVYKAVINTPEADVVTTKADVITINEVTLSFEEY